MMQKKPESRCSGPLGPSLLVIALLTPGLLYGQAAREQGGQGASVSSQPGQSSFTIPSTLNEGRDPFYPESTRFLVKSVTPIPTPVDVPVVLEFKGISGTPDRPLAIINNRTFAIGEEQEVNTSTGRIKLRLLEIDPKAMRVKVLARGETRELVFGKRI